MQNHKPQILHLTYDISLSNNKDKTSAVKDLIRITSVKSSPNTVIIERSSSKIETKIEEYDGGIYLRVFGFPFGFYLLNHLKIVKNNIQRYYSNRYSFDIIHAHKLTFEGIIGYHLSNFYNCKLYVSIRNTDFRVLKYRKDLIPLALKVLNQAEKIFIIAPFMKNRLKEIFGETNFDRHLKHKCIFLPNNINVQNKIDHSNYDGNTHTLVTALRMDKKSIKRKNIKNLLLALNILNDNNLKLKIIGSGPSKRQVVNMIRKYNLTEQVELVGYIDHNLISNYFQISSAFVLPGKAETFGLVYGEALLCGTPILYSKGTGFDGMFEGVGVAVDPKSVESIKNGIKDILLNNHTYRENIKKINKNNGFNIFSEDHIRKVYFRLENNKELIT